jgi:hypothetical protein
MSAFLLRNGSLRHDQTIGQNSMSAESRSNPNATRRVIGVRQDGTRVMLADGLTQERAEFVRRTLSDLIAFRELLVEHDGQSPATFPLWRA